MMRTLLCALLALFLLLAVSAAPVPAEASSAGRLTVYFPNWNVYSDTACQVRNPPFSADDTICDDGLVAGCRRGTALLHVEACGQGELREDGRPFRDLGLQPLPQVALRLPDNVRKTLPGTHHLQKY